MMKNQLAGLMKQAQAMQDNLKRAQDELALLEVEGVSGAGLVKVTMTCKHDVKRITIDPSLLADDKDMLEDLVAARPGDPGIEEELDWARFRWRLEHAPASVRAAAASGARAGSVSPSLSTQMLKRLCGATTYVFCSGDPDGRR